MLGCLSQHHEFWIVMVVTVSGSPASFNEGAGCGSAIELTFGEPDQSGQGVF
jgi:hypothetical protein